ncbi:MAG: DUF1275 domain-containing protein [Acidimicrobiales bacterium]|nr:DUF1275 domain-containing protein [Acidimicrobiales bacterium]
MTEPTATPALGHPLAVAAVLTAAAGAADAICYVGVTGVFTANMSGNAVLLGIGIGEGRPADSLALALSLVSFAVGVGLAAVLGRAGARGAIAERRSTRALGVEAVLLAVLVPASLAVVGAHGDPATGPWRGVLIVIATLAMGAQTVVLRRVGDTAISTTYTSGVMASIGEAAALATVDHDGPSAPRRGHLVVLGTVLVAYVGGAAAGTALHRGVGTWALLAPLVAVVAVAVAALAARPR